MPRYAAFLRGINLGGRRLKMDESRRHFEAVDVENVSTFIASGKVVFDYARFDTAHLELEALRALEGDDDRFQVFGREVVWFRRGRLTDALISTRQIEGALGGAENTMRDLNTVERMVAKFGTPPT
jgi:uncharacterized protein (DUF1697 family)